jgi:hypothetical protein
VEVLSVRSVDKSEQGFGPPWFRVGASSIEIGSWTGIEPSQRIHSIASPGVLQVTRFAH